MTTRIATFAAAALAALVFATPAGAATKFTIRGAGWGHGVGMSQWGAYGFASNGWAYRDILAHYYTGTQIGRTSTREVRVLMLATAVARFRGARSASGRRLSPEKTYSVRRGATFGTVDLISPTGRRMKRVSAPLRVRASADGLVLRGRALNGVASGRYRGAMELRPSGTLGVAAINAVSLEDYIRGVVSRESPSTWPIEALKAQAVAARSYAVTTSKGGDGFDQYPDTRSQVYGGVSAETESTDAAVAATPGEVVTYEGKPVTTYFFSTSGGRTEDVENTSLGNEPKAWLKSVDDPYDDASPRHRWGPIRMTMGRAARKLSGLVKGSFRGVRVARRGRSPRIVEADVVGTDGTTRVTGATLRARLGLYDTWAYFTSISTDDEPTEEEVDGEGEPTPTPSPSPTGGVSPTPEARAATAMARRLTGVVFPARARAEVTVQRREAGAWVTVGVAHVGRRGRYAFALDRTGVYRVRYRGAPGPRVRVT